MSHASNTGPLPKGYVPLPGSGPVLARTARLAGPADAAETFKATIVLRRRTDGPTMPGHDYYAKTPPRERPRVTQAEFAAKFGAHPDDVAHVVRFAKGSGLTVLKAHLSRRTVEVSGTVALFGKAFAVSFARFEHTLPGARGTKEPPTLENFRGWDGFIHVPTDLADVIVAVSGLDNRTVTKSHGVGDPNYVGAVTVQQLATNYNFPTNPADGEYIGIFCPKGGLGGYNEGDFPPGLVTPISTDGTLNGTLVLTTNSQGTPAGSTVLNFDSVPPQVIVGSAVWANLAVVALNGFKVTGFNNTTVTLAAPVPEPGVPPFTPLTFNPDPETQSDISIASQAAPGANIVVFFGAATIDGWLAIINRAVHPDTEAGDPQCSVLSASYSIAHSDDAANLLSEAKVTLGLLTSLTNAFADAAIFGSTICVSSGDSGSSSEGWVGLTPAVTYPASDPNVLSVGGTTVGYEDSAMTILQEYVWNDATGATGGGVSATFLKPTYQLEANVPASLNGGVVGRGVPDVAANASANSPYTNLPWFGGQSQWNGTSSSTPLWAGLIAVINAQMKAWAGFINPTLYDIGSSAFNDINPPPGPNTNGYGNVPGYTAGKGWDPCTGWGSPNGLELLEALGGYPSVYITGGYQSADIVLRDPQNSNTLIPVGGMPGGPADTLLDPNKEYSLSANVHNDSDTEATNVQVTFWSIPGGLGVNGSMVGVPQTIPSIAAHDSINVPASVPFMSAPAGGHTCAAVSLYSPTTGCDTETVFAMYIPPPGYLGAKKCSAWRNTDSLLVAGGSKIGLKLGIGRLPFPWNGPIMLTVNTVLVPSMHIAAARTREFASVPGRDGSRPEFPAELLKDAFRKFGAIDLKPKMTTPGHGKISARSDRSWEFRLSDADDTHSLEIESEIPHFAEKGDVILVKVTASYPRIEKREAGTVEFLEFVYIK